MKSFEEFLNEKRVSNTAVNTMKIIDKDSIEKFVKDAHDGKYDEVQEWLDKGMDIDAMNSWDKTALASAISGNKDKVVELLIDNGADVTLAIDNGGSFIKSSNIDMLRILSKAVINEISIYEELFKFIDGIAKPSDEGYRLFIGKIKNQEYKDDLLYRCVIMNNIDIAKDLLDRGAEANSKYSFSGRLALHTAVANDNIQFVKLLLDHGADVRQKGAFNKTAIDMAKSNEMNSLLIC